jgi:hypothetical protein
MRKLFVLLLICLMPVLAHGAIAAVGGSNCNGAALSTSLSCNYTISAAGNVIILGFQSSLSTISALSCKDSASNVLSTGATALNGTGNATVNVFIFYEVLPSGITSFNCNWTSGATPAIAVEEYSGVNSINATLSGNSATGSASPAAIALGPDAANAWQVCVMNQSLSPTTTITTGNSRQFFGGVPDIYLFDNTETGTGNYTPCQATFSPTNKIWGIATIELKPTVSATGHCASCDLSLIYPLEIE